MVNDDVTIRRIGLADEHKTYAKLLLHVGGKLLFVGTETTVLLKDGAQLLPTSVIRLVIFQCVLHDKLNLYRTQLFTTTIKMY